MKRPLLGHDLLRGVYHYLLFFLLVAFVTTCCMSLFVSILTKSMDITLTAEDLNIAAKLTFANVIVLSILFTLIDALRRKFTVDKPVQRIVAGAEKLMQGDFSVRIPRKSRFAADESFCEVIDCFNRMAQELESVETLRTDFVANVSHEMKTPLSVIQSYGSLLQAPGLSDGQRIEYAKGVTDASRRMADMVTNILKLNRLENQSIYPKSEGFDLSEQLCQSLLQYESIWEAADISIETDIADNVMIQADQELLALVWSNLFSNAFKFTPAGGCVRVSLTNDETHVTVQVQDTGCGMSAEVGSHIFEKFYQGDTSHATRGNGLGLALVKRVVDILRGEISVESTLGEGTTFTVKIWRSCP